ncbi:MAG TPA: phosphate signaling complex protein PhoU [Vicinamibacterales bacterium]|nr:phosphate signaling complex protein PhoU [Vicinamibacterales bacterium]
MERHFHEQLRALEAKLETMGALVEARVRDAMRALVERRADLAVAVVAGDEAVNELELDVDDLSLQLLALQHPVASDLRHVRSAIKVNTDLERIGDQAVNIADYALRLMHVPPLKPVFDVDRLATHALQMLDDAMKAFSTKDSNLARSVIVRDADADDMRDAIFRVLLTHIMADPGTVERALGLIFVSRALERVADHATNIAEDTIFLVEGRVVRHSSSAHDA